MIKIYLPFLLVLGCLCFGCGQLREVPYSGGERETVGSKESSSILKDLQFLSSDRLQGRETGTRGIARAAVYIEEQFRDNHIQPYFSTYRDSFMVSGKVGYNLVGFTQGTDPELKDEWILIGAHYDHIGVETGVLGDSIFNGANDNASGTAMVLALSRELAKVPLKRNVLFVLFSAEEMGLVGARKLARRLHDEKVDLRVMLNMEMLGVPMFTKEFRAYITGYDKSNLAEVFNTFAGKKILGYLPEASQYGLFQRSDNFPFFEEFEIPAHTISTFDFKNYPFYHKVEDEFEHMQISHMEALLQGLVSGIRKMANAEEMGIKLFTE